MSEKSLEEFGLEMPPRVFSARTLSRSVSEVYADTKTPSEAEMLSMIETQHGTMDGIDTKRLGFWRAVISNSSLDSYFTRMAKSSLTNYAADATDPTVSFQNSHRHNELPVGRSVLGQLIESPTSEPATLNDLYPAVIADFYSHRDLQLGDVPVEQFLLGIQSHVIKDVSIGFKEGEGFRNTCSVCGEDYYDWRTDCTHIAGMEYPVTGADPSGEQSTQLCFVWIENARLSEVSAVYDGATTNAMIVKANREARAGRLAADTETYLERRFRFRRDVKPWIKGADLSERMPKPIEPETLPANPDGDTPNSDRSENFMKDEQNGGTSGAVVDTVAPALRALATSLGHTVAETATRSDLESLIMTSARTNADKAVKYDKIRLAEIDAAVQEKIRAEGDQFDATAQARTRSMLEAVDSIETIREFSAEWKAKGDSRFPDGRQSTDSTEVDAEEETPETARTNRDVPAELSYVPLSRFGGGV